MLEPGSTGEGTYKKERTVRVAGLLVLSGCCLIAVQPRALSDALDLPRDRKAATGSMQRLPESESLVAEVRLTDLPDGPVLQPDPTRALAEQPEEVRLRCFPGWEMPLSPVMSGKSPSAVWNIPSGLAVAREAGRAVLEFTLNGDSGGACKLGARTLVTGPREGRNYRVVAAVRALESGAGPSADRDKVSQSLVGVVFRMNTLRNFYLFGIEGKRRVVLYRRWDDEWLALAQGDVRLPDGFVTLDVDLDGDAIRCRCPELGIDFFCTDTLFPEGKAGAWSLGRAQVASLRITQTESQARRNEVRRRNALKEERTCAALVPDPVLTRTLDLKALGGTPEFADFARSGRYDMLIAAKALRAIATDGRLLWETPVTLKGVRFSREHGPHGRLIYGFVGQATGGSEMVVIQGTDGHVVARARAPSLEDGRPSDLFFARSTGNLSGNGPFDIILFQVHGSAEVIRLSAYDRSLKPLWDVDMSVPTFKAPAGHITAVQLFDVDRDGRDEVLAGGTLYSAEGKILWVHDRNDEMATIMQAHHYDAVAIGDFAADPALDPTVFLIASSAGVYVVDGRTGRTRAVHRVGHAQGCGVGMPRNDLPGRQVLVGCRWGNYGVSTLFAGNGDRLWSVQTGDFSGGRTLIQWGDRQLILMDQSLIDGYGRRVKDLRHLGPVSVARIGEDTSDSLCAIEGKIMRVFSPGPSGQVPDGPPNGR